VLTGGKAVNPVNQAKSPVWIADYGIISYGTGAIMAVPGHDERDWAFAKKFGLDIIEVISGGNVEEAAHTGDGALVNSDILNGLNVTDAKAKIIDWLEAQGLGKKAVNYRLRDWLFSRQRYWGEPFPVVYGSDGEPQPLPEQRLPITLPEVERYTPTGTGESPLAGIDDWVNVTDSETGEPMRRETNTMPQWAGSCWYYLRFIDPQNSERAWDAAKEKYWMPVDLYVGGAEHAVLHLLYARFWHKVLYDLGHVSTKEPFGRLFHQGMILGFANRYQDNTHPELGGNDRYVHADNVKPHPEDPNKAIHADTGEVLDVLVEKMSKSRGNVVNPDDVVGEFGADTLRLYEMYMGPLEATKPWDSKSVPGMYRFLGRCWRLVMNQDAPEADAFNPKLKDVAPSKDTERLLHQTIKKVGEDVEGLRFNTAIAQMIELCNHLTKLKQLPRSVIETFILLLSPFAPHLAEELWARLGHGETLAYEPWPVYDAAKCVEDTITIAVQVMGKTRGTIEIARDAAKDVVLAMAREVPAVARQLEGKTLRKEIYVPGRIVNFVAT